MGNFDPFVYKTSDYGQSWKLISSTVPKSIHSFAHVIKEDPKKEGMLYLGVDNGIYVSFNDGENWMRLKNNLPPSPVYWLEIQEYFDDLVVGTYGRGYYILDNISPLREYANEVQNKDVHLFSLRQAYRFHNKQSIKTDGPSLNSGRNPAYGADINYFLKDSTNQKVEIQILSQNDEIIRTLKGSGNPGVNRVMWDLRYEPTYKPYLRSTPPGRPWVQLNGEGWRPLVTWDLDLWRGQFGPRAVPDTYKVKLIVGEQEFVRELKIIKDPKSEGSLDNIKTQVALSLELRDAMNIAVNMINTVEIIRSELNFLIPKLTKKRDITSANKLLENAVSVAGSLYDIHLTGAREDAFRSPMKLYGRLSALASDLGAHGIDFKPTEQQKEVSSIFNNRLKTISEQFSKLINSEVDKLNNQLKKSQLKIELEKKIKM
jgi:hypothetical protein